MKKEKQFGKPPCLFKVNISTLEYQLFTHYYKSNEIKEMWYLYLDTSLYLEEAQLCRAKIRLRVRIRENHISLELKYKENGKSKNYSQPISLFELNLIFQGSLPNGTIREIINDLNYLNKFVLVSATHTKRAKRYFGEGILVLDQTVSAHSTFFQIEFRSDKHFSVQDLLKIKEELGILRAGRSISKLSQIWEIEKK